DQAVVVAAEGGGALQVQHFRMAGQLGDRGGDPVQRRGAVELDRVRQQRAAGLGLLVDQGDAGPGASGTDGGGQPGGASAHDEHVYVVVDGVVPGTVGDIGQAALARQAAGDQAVVELDRGGQQHR